MGVDDGVPEPGGGAPRITVRQEEWEDLFESWGRSHARGIVRMFSRLPSAPRCEACGSPFGGVGGKVMRALGKGPSRKNPRWCGLCFENAPEGGFVTEVGVLFVDVRGSTAMGETLSSVEMAGLLNEFYERVTRVVMRHGLIDKLIGDEVMGVYHPALVPDRRHVQAMAEDAVAILEAIGFRAGGEPLLDVGIGIAAGEAFMGNVGVGTVTDFTVIGDVVNIAARLQTQAAAGEIVTTDAVARDVGWVAENGERVLLELKGKSESLHAWRLPRPS